jgi:hypothetical protein
VTAARVQVGILDSGADVAAREACAFEARDDGVICAAEPWPDYLRHGTIIAQAIEESVRSAEFLVAQIFGDRPTTTPAIVTAGLDWLVDKGARIVTMSFGLRADRPVLHEACMRAVAAGVILVAASPARGGAVFPAAYPGVISVSGDARLQKGELSVLGPDGHFGAYAWLEGTDETGRPRSGGASFAVATLACHAARFLERTPHASPADVIDYLTKQARYQGPERISSNGGV